MRGRLQQCQLLLQLRVHHELNGTRRRHLDSRAEGRILEEQANQRRQQHLTKKWAVEVREETSHTALEGNGLSAASTCCLSE